MDVDERERWGATVAYVGTTNATDMPVWKDGEDAKPHDCYNFGPARNTVYLNDGSRYVVYRFSLHMDGFKEKKSKRDTREVAGCYMLPLGLTFENRRGSGSPRVLTLGSSSVSHNGVLKLLLGNIRRGATAGVDGVDPYGRTVRIFLDPVTSLADYPAAAKCTDSYGHTGNAYCTHCTNIKRAAPGGSKILSTPMNHSRRVGFHRSDARLSAIRKTRLKSDVYRNLGIKSDDEHSSQDLPLFALANSIRSAARPEQNEFGEDVSPLIFQSSLNCAAAPDHLFYGLTKNMLSVLFDAFSPDRRAALEKRIGSTAR